MPAHLGVALAERTTLRVGGPARRLVEVSTEAEVIDAVREIDGRGEPLLILGGGSNVLIADEGFDGTVVHVATRGAQLESKDMCGGANVVVAAGEPWDELVARAVEERWIGVEALSGIPGSTGATPIQNVGAYGQEVGDTLARVRTYDRERQAVRTFFHSDCKLGYRTSLFKGSSRWVVLDVTFQLLLGSLGQPIRYPELARKLGVEVGQRAPSRDVREAVLALRRGKGMVLDDSDHDTWSAGSFFTNPLLDPAVAAGLPPEAPRWVQPDGTVKTSAAWLIERAGFHRGHGAGPARISTRHTLALTNRGGATTADVLALAREVRDGVQSRFGVSLVPEPTFVGCAL